ncbi:unnamed protein product [Dicrocoelium dendriticum]|nr:unnamed protein product [Dicrocoelium dendriticum]
MSASSSLKLLLFGEAKEVAAKELRELILRQIPGLLRLEDTLLFVLDLETLDCGNSHDDVFYLTFDAIKPSNIIELVTDPSCGAISAFFGTTRAYDDNRLVVRLEYEAYESMALNALQCIIEEVRTKFPCLKRITVVHRLGSVAVEEISVAIAVSSPHRAASLDAVAYIIEQIKRRVPIWKKEVYSDNTSSWKRNTEYNV